MRRKPLILVTLTVAVAAFTLGAGQVVGQQGERQEAPAEEPLLALMEGMKTHLKGTAIALQDESKREDALMHVAEMQRYLLLAKLRTPSNLAELPEEKRGEHRVAFRRDLAQVLKVLVDLEVHVLDGDNAEAFKLVAGSLFSLREEAHAKYQSAK